MVNSGKTPETLVSSGHLHSMVGLGLCGLQMPSQSAILEQRAGRVMARLEATLATGLLA